MPWVGPMLAAAIFGGTTLMTLPAGAQSPATRDTPAVRPPSADGWLVDRRLLAVGAGAVVGAVVFNVLSAPLGIVPLAGGTLDAVPLNVALGSRLIGVVSAGAGALGATLLYDHWTGYRSDYTYALTLGAGAFAGVAIGNFLQVGVIGTLPYYVGAGVANATDILAAPAEQAASRIYVIASGVLGAWVADFVYRHKPQ